MPRRSLRLGAQIDQTGATRSLGSAYIRLPPQTARLSSTRTADGQSTNPKNDDLPFRLLDLPPEIRNRIYSYHFTAYPKRDLSYFSIPPITLASRQTRDESLPILFAETNFRVVVAGNFQALNRERTEQAYYQGSTNRSISGTVSSKRILSSFLKHAGEAGLFRDVTFEVHDSSEIRYVRVSQRHHAHGKPPPPWSNSGFVVLLHLQVVGGKLVVEREEGRDFPRWSMIRDHPQRAKDVARAVAKAENVAREVASKDGFKGLQMSDLRKVAKAFRLSLDD